MMRFLLSIALFIMFLPLAAVSASAQPEGGKDKTSQAAQPQKREPLPDIPPPPPEMAPFDDAVEPQVTIVNRGEEKHEEYRMNGKLYMVKVTPKVGPSYYLVDDQGSGQFVRRDSLDGGGLTPPRWVILRF